jgi:hypothetical protein
MERAMSAQTSKSQTPIHETEPERVKRILAESAERAAGAAQIILILDSAGLRAELPGINGATRRKINLTPDFADRNPEFMEILESERLRIALARKVTIEAQKSNYIDPQIERERRNAEIARERARRHQEWIESLPKDRREIEQKKLETRLQNQLDSAKASARQIWLDIAQSHGIKLANRVIDDPSRRPRRKVMVPTATGMREVSPQNVAKMDAALNGTKAPRTVSRKFTKAELEL